MAHPRLVLLALSAGTCALLVCASAKPLSPPATATVRLPAQPPSPPAAPPLLLLPRAPRSLKLEATGVLLGTALAVEPKPFSQRGSSLAEGLTEVLHALRRNAVTGARRVDAVLACQPGDSFWGTEFSRVHLRNASLMPEPLRVHVAGEGLGDGDAGAGPSCWAWPCTGRVGVSLAHAGLSSMAAPTVGASAPASWK